MPYPSSPALRLATFAALLNVLGCSSKFRNNNEGESSSGGMSSTASGGTSTTSSDASTTSGASEASGDSGGTSAGGGSATAAATDTGGSAGTDAGDTGGSSAGTDAGGNTGTGAGGNTTSAGGATASNATSAGGSGGTDAGGSAGTGGSPVVMACDPDEAGCECDALGCFLVDGASCTTATDCRTQVCGVTQDAVSVCCSEACGEDEVCAEDGDGCEAADVCEDNLERCSAEGDHQRCSDGQWDTIEECNGMGCSVDLTGGCLSPLGEGCDESDECGQGTCQETIDGSSACCDASCGSCQVCNAEGTGCVEPAEVMPGCDCTAADTSNCDDDIPCTVDTCQDGSCSNEVESGYCLIDGACYDHNQPEPGNACRYCDAALRDRAWTYSGNTVSCNDSVWCNGTDTCDGTGQCQHQFPTLARCTESGPCALTTCDEERDSCYQPDTFECETEYEDRCKPVDGSEPKCGGDLQRSTTSTFCSGTSAACDGATTTSSFVNIEDCRGHCDPETVACVQAIGCVSTCDAGTGLCWNKTEAADRTFSQAQAYCNGLVAGSRDDWRLPSINEWLLLAKGCDDATGEAQPVTFQSTCTFDAGDDPLAPCTSGCPDGEGPASGCYWPMGMSGDCSAVGYWSGTSARGAPGKYTFMATTNWVALLDQSIQQDVRCVTEQE